MVDYPCAKFGNFGLSRFGFIVRTDRQTDRITDADDRYTHANTVGVSNEFYAHPSSVLTIGYSHACLLFNTRYLSLFTRYERK